MTLDSMDKSGNSTLMESSKVIKSKFILHDFLVTVKAVHYECVIRTGQP